MKNIVLNIPHSSVNGIFDNKIGGWKPNPYFINNIVYKNTDWFTDMLFTSKNPDIVSVIFPYSRFVCDAERLENDDLEKIGQGIIYSEFEGYSRDVDNIDSKLIIDLWKNHQNELIKNLNENSVLIDCHSFSQKKDDECDICIGYNNDWSYDETIVDIIINEFKKNGYDVKVNSPYSNSITPKTDFKYSSVMIEVNKRVYMNENTLKLNQNPRQWMRWYGTLKKIYEKILNF